MRVATGEGDKSAGNGKPDENTLPTDTAQGSQQPGGAGATGQDGTAAAPAGAPAAAPAFAEDLGGANEGPAPDPAPAAPAGAEEGVPEPPVVCSFHGSLVVGDRVKFNFAGTPSKDEWHGGVVGSKSEGGMYVGFDDGDLRQFERQEMQGLHELGMLLRMGAGEHSGLINNAFVADMAVGVTMLKEGRMGTPKVVGVLVGKHAHGIAGLPVHVAHFVDASAFATEEPAEGGRILRAAAQKCTAAVAEARKGYHTFRCGDYVECTADAAKETSVAVFGVMVCFLSTQLRRVLVLCEDPDKDNLDASQFFLAPWAMWSRVPTAPRADGSHDVDDDEAVCAATASCVQKMRTAWTELDPLKKIHSQSAIVYAVTGKGRGLPPSVRLKPQPKPHAPPNPRTPKPSGGGRGKQGGRGGVRKSKPAGAPAPAPTPSDGRTPQPLRTRRDRGELDGSEGALPSPRRNLTDLTGSDDRGSVTDVQSMQDFGEEQGADGGDDDAELVRLRAKLAAAKRAAQDRKVAQEKEKAKIMQELLALEQEKEHSGMAPAAQQPAQPPPQLYQHGVCQPPSTPTHRPPPPSFQIAPNLPAAAGLQHYRQHQPAQQYWWPQQLQDAPPTMCESHAASSASQITPESERAISRTIAILQAQQFEDGVEGLAGKIAGSKYDREKMRKDRKRKSDGF
uniref:Uncharacterized protein n=1 Tax=Chrysotila carterae TaxID=13221 RepID=A0A7S4C279_CHRCT